MRKQHGIVKRAMACVLSAVLLLGMVPAFSAPAEAAAPAAAATSWMTPYLDTMVDWDVIRPDASGNMHEYDQLTRADFVAMVNRAFGYEEVGPNPFSDVPDDAWYAEDICIAYKAGYFKGTTETTASPNALVTREQAAVLLARNLRLQGTPGEVLDFSDSRQMGNWSRSLVQEAARLGIIQGYEDGTFRPKNPITRGQMSAFLVRALGTLIREPGEYSNMGVYGHMTINEPGVTLKDTVITGNLYLTGGVGLGNIELENVQVQGKIVVCGAGESQAGESSIVLRNVTADAMEIDSLTNQFLTVRSEGLTDISETTVRTSAYIEDLTNDGLGLQLIKLDGASGTQLAMAGNIKEFINLTPGSAVNMAQGVAQKVTIDEEAAGSTLNIDSSTNLKELNLDTATTVTGGGDVDHLNVNAAGSSVEMLPDTITIRPGLTADIYGTEMDSEDAAESSEDPRILSGYPAARNVAPTSLDAFFSTNKPGKLYWGLTALADGSIEEEDLVNPPVYATKIIKNGSMDVKESKTELSAKISGLTKGGSYYISGVLVDNRGMRSPVKVDAFTTPDDTTPAFATGYPKAILAEDRDGETVIQGQVMATKDCVLYYALLPDNSTAPTAADFKANAVTGNLGYGTAELKKNTPWLISQINTSYLTEKTNYDLYFWLTDADGAKSSAVKKVEVTTPDKTPPKIQRLMVTDVTATSVKLSFALDEPGTLYWGVVKEGDQFYQADASGQTPTVHDELAKMQIETGMGALKKGNARASKGAADYTITVSGLQAQTTYDFYFVAKDTAGNYNVYTTTLTPPIQIKTLDKEGPTVEQEFTRYNENQADTPQANTDIRLVFSESVQGMELIQGKPKYTPFLDLYNAVLEVSGTDEELAAREKMADTLRKHITLMYVPPVGEEVEVGDRSADEWTTGDPWAIDFRYVDITMESGKMVLTFPAEAENKGAGGINLSSGATYYFVFNGITDTANPPNPMGNNKKLPEFTTVFATVLLGEGEVWTIPEGDIKNGDQDDNVVDGSVRVDMAFNMDPQGTQNVDSGIRWDALIWSDTTMTYSIYSRPQGATEWTKLGTKEISVAGSPDGLAFSSLHRHFRTGGGEPTFPALSELTEPMEYAIHVDKIGDSEDYTAWNEEVTVRIMVVAGIQSALRNLSNRSYTQHWEDSRVNDGVVSIGVRDPFALRKIFTDSVAPQLVDNYPTFDVGDIAAEINVMLDRPGRVYYAAAPLTNLEPAKTPPIDVQDETQVAAITGYNSAILPTDTNNGRPMPKDVPTSGPDKVELISPGVNSIAEGNYTGNVKSGQVNAPAAYTEATIFLEDLLPDTIYYLYLVTQGTSAVQSERVICYRFTTEEASRPIITMDITNPSVNVDVDRASTLDYILVLTGQEGDGFSDLFSKYLATGYTESTYSSLFPGDTNITVLDAMTKDVVVDNASTGTVFDLYASEAAKIQFATRIRNQASAGTNAIMKGTAIDFPEGVTTVECTGMVGTNRYTFLAVGKSKMGSGDAFRAILPVYYQDTTPPYVDECLLSGTVSADGTTFSGSLTVSFSEYLYLRTQTGSTGQTTTAVDGCSLGKVGTTTHPATYTDHVAMGSLLLMDTGIGHGPGNHGTNCDYVRFVFTNARDGSSVMFDRNLCDQPGNGTTRSRLTLTLRIEQVAEKTHRPYIEVTETWDNREGQFS